MNILIVGASRGLGHAFAKGLNKPGRHFFLLSRTEPEVMSAGEQMSATWIKADLTTEHFSAVLCKSINDTRIDLLIYNAGTWEKHAFSDQYDFAKSSYTEIVNIITVNLTAAILTVQAVLPNLLKSTAGKIILIGSTSGLENNRTKEVAYQASKFGLRGLNNALRELLRGTKVNSTVLNLGDLATQVSYEDSRKAILDPLGQTSIPLRDVVEVVNSLLNLSPAALIKEINMPGSIDMSL